MPAVEAVLTVLRHGLTFRSFTNDMLGYFYEEALVTPEMRREMGVFYTPRSLAERMLSRLPIEELEPNRRDVLDPTCGSASLLVAAYGRLQGLMPHQMKRDAAHRYFTRHLHGVDKDPFAAGVARLALFLRDLPEGDSWDIRQGDSLLSKTTDGLRPSIIVGNPPFRERLGARSQIATLFLQRSMDILEDGGLMAMVLPETFLVAHSGDQARRHLFENFDVMEILQLPEGEFRSGVATTVVVARKRVPPRPYAMLVERVAGTAAARTAFRTGGEASMSTVKQIEPGVEPASTALVASVDNAILSKLASHRRVGELVEVKNGIIVGRSARSSVGPERRSSQSRPWLAGTDGLQPFRVDNTAYQDRFIEYTEQLQWQREALRTYFETPGAKALVNANRAPTSPWRLKAAVDDEGYFPSQGLHCLIPRSAQVDLDAIVAVLNSMAVNLWVDTYNRTRWIREGMVETLPYPTLSTRSSAALHRLAASASEVMRSGADAANGATTMKGILGEIDEIVFAAFGLSRSEVTTVEQYFRPHRRPGLEAAATALVTSPSASAGERWALGGRVVEVDGDRGALKVYLDGLNDDQLIDIHPLPPRIPGWMLRPGVEFEATIPLAARLSGSLVDSDLADFRVREFGYCDQEELRVILADPKRLLKLYD
ncbi:MAG: N-6 DNA methylase [Candidatus Dormibacteria bacterium]